MRAFHQRGVTLISLLIGMVVSLLAILACLSMFSDLIRVSGEAKVDAIQDGSLATALLRVQTELQGVGYLMGPNRVVAGVAQDYSVTTNSIAWRFNNGTATIPVFVCQRLDSATANGVYTLKLQRLKTANAGLCNTAAMSTITTDQWEDVEVLSQVKFYDANQVSTNAAAPLVTFAELTATVCGPYGAGVTESTSSSSGGAGTTPPDLHPIISITKLTAAAANGSNDDVHKQRFDVCLVNIVIP